MEIKPFETSDKIDKIGAALTQLQTTLTNPAKTAKAHHGKYANLETVIEHVKEPCANVGITIFQQALTDHKGNLGVLTRLIHSSGQYFQSFISTNINDGRDVGKMCQQHGVLISYYRRYQILGALFLKDEDDDGDSSTQIYSKKEFRKTPPETTKENPKTRLQQQQNKEQSEKNVKPTQGKPLTSKFDNNVYLTHIKTICNKESEPHLKLCIESLGVKYTDYAAAFRFLNIPEAHGGPTKLQKIKVLDFISKL
mgnify:CR=1 FL=1